MAEDTDTKDLLLNHEATKTIIQVCKETNFNFYFIRLASDTFEVVLDSGEF